MQDCFFRDAAPTFKIPTKYYEGNTARRPALQEHRTETRRAGHNKRFVRSLPLKKSVRIQAPQKERNKISSTAIKRSRVHCSNLVIWFHTPALADSSQQYASNLLLQADSHTALDVRTRTRLQGLQLRHH